MTTSLVPVIGDEDLKLARDGALEFVNDVRTKLGAPTLSMLARGEMGRASCCPISRSLCGSAVSEAHTSKYGTRIVKRDEPQTAPGHWFPGNTQVARFVQFFDAGLIPELVIPDEPVTT